MPTSEVTPSHYLLDPYTWPWSPNGHSHYIVMNNLLPSALPFWDTAISKFDHENPWSRPCVWSKVKVTFDLENSKFKVMAKVKPIGHIWGLESNWYVCFSFHGNQTLIQSLVWEFPFWMTDNPISISDVTWLSWHLKSPAVWQFVQKFIQANKNDNTESPHNWTLCVRNPPVTGGFPPERASDAEKVSMS